jgi:ubiquinone/menaquinone biosynthesis C-methylase UbiE
MPMAMQWTANDILTMARSYQYACVLTAAADLDVFAILSDGAKSVDEAAEAMSADPRGTRILLDALAALELLEKTGDRYGVSDAIRALLTADSQHTVLDMVRHQGSCLRRWAQLEYVVKRGEPAERIVSVRGDDADRAAFIGAMDDVNKSVADQVVRDLMPIEFTHLLDLGGASGTWALAWLRAKPEARATVFDLPHVEPMAKRRIGANGMTDRITFVAGDFTADPLPDGTDLCWISAIVHQNSAKENRVMLRKVHEHLAPGGRVLIRDAVMDETRTSPAYGALFAVNMLTGTPGGDTFTFDELRAMLEDAGFERVELRRADEGMSAVVAAVKR